MGALEHYCAHICNATAPILRGWTASTQGGSELLGRASAQMRTCVVFVSLLPLQSIAFQWPCGPCPCGPLTPVGNLRPSETFRHRSASGGRIRALEPSRTDPG